MGLFNFCRAVLLLLVTLLCTGVTAILAVLGALLFRLSPSTLQSIPRAMWHFVSWLGGVEVKVEGGEGLDHNKSYIFAANHQSMYDIIALQGFLNFDFRWMAKKELFKIPLFGLGMRKAGYIPIDRSHGREALKSLDEAARKIASGDSVVIFPEGTRSSDGILQPFKPGAMVLAIKAGVPLVPVAIIGTHAILPKKKLLFRPGKILIRVGEAVETKGYTVKQKQELAQIIHDKVLGLMATEQTV